MAYVVGVVVDKEELIESLQCGDYVLLLGYVYKWEKDDYGNDYGEDIQLIPLLATMMMENGYNFDITGVNNVMKRTYKDNIIVSWDPKTRNLTYSHGAFKGGIEKVDTVDKFQRALRSIGLKDAANGFNPKSSRYS